MNEARYLMRLATLEAALYSAGRPVEVESLKLVIKTKSTKVVLKFLDELSLRYQARRSALEVKILPGGRAVMRLKEEYDKTVKRFTNKPLLSVGPLKTLSYIAYHQPVEQVKVAADRGSHVYSHLRQMEEIGLITREKLNGRGYIIETTPYFSEYFGFGQDPMATKIQLRQMFSTMQIHKMDNGSGGSIESDILEDAFGDGPLANSMDGYP